MKKVIAFLLAVMVLIGVSPMALAQTAVHTAVQEKATFDAPGNFFTQEIDLDALEQYLFEQFAACKPVIDMSGFRIRGTEENLDLIWNLVYYQMPESFHVTSVGISYTFTILSLQPVYAYTAEEYAQMYTDCMAKADELLADIEGNDALSDVEKALLLHDRIALCCNYDYDGVRNDTLSQDAYTMYGALCKGLVVCLGYAQTYQYLLERVGIKSELCTSESLNHAWNIVYIDDTPYHVDVTWDDSSGTSVYHYCFLLSSDAMYENGHDATDYNTAPNDTRYDDAAWLDVSSPYYLITLDANGGAVEPNYLLATREAAEIPPTPTRAGYDFIGWASTPDAESGTPDIVAQDNQTYYAVWMAHVAAITEIEIVAAPTKTSYYVGEPLDTTGLQIALTYEDGKTETVTQGFAVSGFDANGLGTQIVTVAFGDVSTTFEVYVEERPQIKGDMDGNDLVDVADILKLRNIILDEEWNDEQLAHGDMDDGGTLDVADIVGIKLVIFAA